MAEVRVVTKKQVTVKSVAKTQEESIVRHALKGIMEIRSMVVVNRVHVPRQERTLQRDALCRKTMCNAYVNKGIWDACVRNVCMGILVVHIIKMDLVLNANAILME